MPQRSSYAFAENRASIIVVRFTSIVHAQLTQKSTWLSTVNDELICLSLANHRHAPRRTLTSILK